MNSRKTSNVIEGSPVQMKTGRISEACQRYNVGATTMRALAEEAGAVVRINRIWLCNFTIMDDWMDKHSDMV